MTSRTELRRAEPADRGAIAALPGLSASTRRLLAADLAGVHPRHRLVALETSADPRTGPGTSPGTTNVVNDGTIVGFAMATRAPDEVHLLDLAVARGHRRRGVGGRLVAGVASAAGRDGATAMTLEVRVSNGPARALYEHLGFLDRGLRPRYYRDGEGARILWHRDLEDLVARAVGARDQRVGVRDDGGRA